MRICHGVLLRANIVRGRVRARVRARVRVRKSDENLPMSAV